jgi:hypothetical protein
MPAQQDPPGAGGRGSRPPRCLTVTAPYEPGAVATRGRTTSGGIRRAARRWRAGLAWSARLQALTLGWRPAPPYAATVHAYGAPPGADGGPGLEAWFAGIAQALGQALGVEAAQVTVRAGRVAAPGPYLPAHLAIVVTGAGGRDTADAPGGRVSCPACGAPWDFDPASAADDRCPRCGHEGAGLPYLLGILGPTP